MEKIINSLKIHNLNIKHKKVMLLVVSLIILLGQYVNYYFYILDKNRIYSSLRGQTYVIAILTLFFLINGYFSGKSEEENKCKEVFSCILKGEIYNLTGSLLLGIIYSIITISILNIVIVIFYLKSSNVLILKQIIEYIIQYHLIPIIIGYITGYVIGNNIKGNKGYLFIIIIWFLITPLNSEVFKIISNIFSSENVNYLKWFITQGSINPQIEIYNSIIGIYVSTNTIIKNMAILIFLLIITYKKYLRKKHIIFFLTSIMILFCGYMYSNIKSVEIDILQNKKQYDNIKFDRENDYLNTKFTIDSIDGNIKFDYKTEFELNLKISNLEDKTLTLYLHPLFVIENIVDDSGQTINFTRNKGEVNLILNSLEANTLKIKYYGFSQYGMYMSKDFIYLPTYINYIPSNRSGFIDNNEIEYNINTNIKDNIYTNLESKNKDTVGKSKEGLMLISTNQLRAIEVDSYNIYYAPSYYSEEDIKLNARKIINGYKFYEKLFTELFDYQHSSINKIFIINIPLLPSLAIISNNSLLVQDYNSVITDESFLEVTVKGNSKGNYQNNQLNNTFTDEVYVNLIKKYSNKKYNTSFRVNNMSNMNSKFNEASRIENLTNKMGVDDLKEFIKDYYNIINYGIDRSSINELVNLYEKRGSFE